MLSGFSGKSVMKQTWLMDNSLCVLVPKTLIIHRVNTPGHNIPPPTHSPGGYNDYPGNRSAG